ncbi:hypothetical protein KJ673_00185 [Patescibacteria group bacterium]|nr:hypothetical protein [Patescibacteria group bacterium]MBU4453279.1 hypothetical protein [Patescibacteria group bacterium]MCG2687318.1 hypothetical protein [Candidatus Parcubacteria bacterium]
MIIKARDKKKERTIIISTTVGILLILCVWGFQIHSLFTETLAKETHESGDEMSALVDELAVFQEDIESKLPSITSSFDDLFNAFRLHYQAQVDEQKALQAQQDAFADKVAQETIDRLDLQAPQADDDLDNQETIE